MRAGLQAGNAVWGVWVNLSGYDGASGLVCGGIAAGTGVAQSTMGARTGACGELRYSTGDCVFADEGRHGNFFDASYAAIAARPEWMRRFDKIHAQGRALPKSECGRRWRELDSSMSSDALLMNVFCSPGVVEDAAVRRTLGVDSEEAPIFGWKARVPLASGPTTESGSIGPRWICGGAGCWWKPN